MTEAAGGALVRIVDDDAVLRDSLAFLLEAAGWESRCYADAAAFLTADAPSQAGCVILDVRMPGMSGLELQAEMNRRGYTLPIIFLTGHGDMEMAVGAMKMGAVDFISKPVDPEKFIAAVRRALAKQSLIGIGVRTPGEAVRLFGLITQREQQICRELAKGKTNREAARVFHISERTVEAHRASAMRKLNIKNVRELADLIDEVDKQNPDRG